VTQFVAIDPFFCHIYIVMSIVFSSFLVIVHKSVITKHENFEWVAFMQL
jgi:hypothetical protein